MKPRADSSGKYWRYAAAFVAALLSASVIHTLAAPAGANTTGNGLVVQDLTFTSQPKLLHVDGTDRLVLASGSTVQIWSTAGALLHTLTNIGDVTDIASSGNRVAMVANGDNAVVVIDVMTGLETHRVSGITDTRSDIAIDGDSVWWLARIAGTDPNVPDGSQPFEIIHFLLSNSAGTSETIAAPDIFADGGKLDAIPGEPNSVIYSDNGSGDYWRIFAGGASHIQCVGGLYVFSGFDDTDNTYFWAVDLAGKVVKVSVASMSVITGTASADTVATFPFRTSSDGASSMLYNGNGPDFRIMPAADPAQRQHIVFSPGDYNESDIAPTQVFTIWSKQLAQSGWTGSVHKLVIANRSLATSYPFPTTTTTTTTTTAPTTTTTAAPTTTTTTAPTTTTTTPPPPRYTLTFKAFAHGQPLHASIRVNAGCQGGYTDWLQYNVPFKTTFAQWEYCTLQAHYEAPRGTYIRLIESADFAESLFLNRSMNETHDDTATLIDYYPSAFTDLYPFVFEQFEVVLHRQPTTPEFNYWWAQFVDHGAKDFQIATRLMANSEFSNKVRPVSRLYLAYFDRWSDRGGEAYWVNLHQGGLHLNEISAHFASSEEFQLTYGNLSNRDFVELIYRNVLHRMPDQSGVGYWTSFLDSGKLTRGELMVQFSESVEYRALTDAEIAVRSIVFGEVELEPYSVFLADQAALYRSNGGDLSALVTQLLRSSAYHDKFYWHADTGSLTVAAAQGLSGEAFPVSAEPGVYDGEACDDCPEFERD